MKKIFVMALLVALALAPAAAEAYWVDVAAGFWSPEPSGGISYDDGTGTATVGLDLDNVMGMEKESIATIRAKVDLPLLNLAFMATPLTYEGTNILTSGVTFGGVTFPVSTPVTTELTMDQLDFTMFWAVPFLETATADMLNLEFGINARMLDVEASIAGGGLSESKTFSVTVPMIYLALQIRPTDSISIEAEYKGLSVGDNSYTDTIARLKWSPLPVFNVSAGYRSQALELDEDGVVSDIEFKGPFFEAGLQF